MKFKAVRLYSEGGRRVSRMLEQSLDDLDPGEVVIKSQYAAVNYKDARAVSGVGNVIVRFPCIPGVEVAGTVVESRDPAFRPGDPVTVQGGRDFGMRRDGAYSEYVRVPAGWIGRIPAGTDAFEAVALGLAAYTSALAVEELAARGVTPDKGPILVTGGTGGSASFAIDMLAGLGYHVVASTGKSAEATYLKSIGAADVVGRDGIAAGGKPLEEQRWAGAIDTVGGAPLDALLRSMQRRGVVCAFGNAAGETLNTSIYPFILRGVSLIGINGNHPVPERGSAWARMARGGDLRPRHIGRIAYAIAFDALQAHCDKLIGAGVRGRAVVKFG
ncbi:MAG: acryloyl-CoA reductase [Betaproteobacteria bacterium]|nr:acryloyl-CoA reductase [Betaproteobacteria bacterium]